MAVVLFRKNDSGEVESKKFDPEQFEQMIIEGWGTSREVIKKNDELLEQIASDKDEMDKLRLDAKEIGYERYQVANKPTLKKVLKEHDDNKD